MAPSDIGVGSLGPIPGVVVATVRLESGVGLGDPALLKTGKHIR